MIYHYELKQINGFEYRSPLGTFKNWTRALRELQVEEIDIERMTIDEKIQEARSLVGALGEKIDEIYPNPDFVNIMMKDWSSIGFELQALKILDCSELHDFELAAQEEMSILLKNLITDGKSFSPLNKQYK